MVSHVTCDIQLFKKKLSLKNAHLETAKEVGKQVFVVANEGDPTQAPIFVFDTGSPIDKSRIKSIVFMKAMNKLMKHSNKFSFFLKSRSHFLPWSMW